MLFASEARNLRKDERIERLEKLVAAFKQAAFGRRSEKSDPDQLELALENLETAIAAIHAEEDAEDRATKRPAKPRATNRGSLPKHLLRIEEVIEPNSLTCACGGCLHCIGEDVSERLDIIPAQFRVIVTRRPKYACRSCTDGVVQAPAPARLIPGGMPTEATVAHVLVSNRGADAPQVRATPRGPIIFPCIAKRRFTADRVSILIDPPLQTGWAVPPMNCAPSSTR
jgi:transposase